MGLEPIECFPATKPGDSYIFLRAGDIILELMPSEAGPVGFHHISFIVDDLSVELAALKGEGVKCTMDPVDAGSGINIGFFEDQNGLKLQVFCRTKVKTLVWSERSEPSAVVLKSTYKDGTTFRSGITFEVGKGRIFYFRPGHETFPIMKLEMIRRIIRNAALWVAHRH